MQLREILALVNPNKGWVVKANGRRGLKLMDGSCQSAIRSRMMKRRML